MKFALIALVASATAVKVNHKQAFGMAQLPPLPAGMCPPCSAADDVAPAPPPGSTAVADAGGPTGPYGAAPAPPPGSTAIADVPPAASAPPPGSSALGPSGNYGPPPPCPPC